MRRRFLSAVLFLAGGAVSCYQPSYTGPYVCDPRQAGADCPDGWSCIQRSCVAPGALPPDQGSHSACADQGSLLAMAHGGQVWACPGTFAQGDFATLCAADLGSHVCGQDPHDESLLMLLDCDSLSGFYLTQLNLTVMKDMVSMMYQGQCDSPPGGGQHAILGCGTTSGVTQLNSPDCHYLHDALICPAAGDWSCTPQKGLDDVTYRATTGGGVLCCSSGLR